MKKILTAAMVLSLCMSMSAGMIAHAERTDTITALDGAIVITEIDITGTASIVTDFLVDPNAALADIWTGADIDVVNLSGAPIFYVFDSVAAVGFPGFLPVANALTDVEWTNIGEARTLAEFWIGSFGAGGAPVELTGIYAGETPGENVLLSTHVGNGTDADTTTLDIRTGTSWAAATTITLNIVTTFELAVGDYSGPAA